MLAQLVLGSIMILTTTVIHGVFTTTGLGALRKRYAESADIISNWRASLVLALFVLWLFLATIVEVWAWAGLYLLTGAVKTLEEAVYFSTVTFTTLGYGDVVLDPSWRLLSSFEAANGLFLFGWSTALVFAVVQWIFGHSRAGQR